MAKKASRVWDAFFFFGLLLPRCGRHEPIQFRISGKLAAERHDGPARLYLPTSYIVAGDIGKLGVGVMQEPMAIKPTSAQSVTTTLFLPLEQWQIRRPPFSLRPTTTPIWDSSAFRAKSPGSASAAETTVRFVPLYQLPSLGSPALWSAQSIMPEQSRP